MTTATSAGFRVSRLRSTYVCSCLTCATVGVSSPGLPLHTEPFAVTCRRPILRAIFQLATIADATSNFRICRDPANTYIQYHQCIRLYRYIRIEHVAKRCSSPTGAIVAYHSDVNGRGPFVGGALEACVPPADDDNFGSTITSSGKSAVDGK